MIRLLPATGHRRMPWKNGGGFTTEIAIGPEGAALDQFDWRVSMAEIMTDGPFSSFAGIDRTLSILEGNGIRLTVGGETTVLTRESAPFGFPGDAATSAILVDGPVIDLNVMTRRGVIEHRVTRLEEPVAISGCRMTLFVQSGARSTTASVAGSELRLEDRDALLISDEQAPLALRPGAGAALFKIEF